MSDNHIEPENNIDPLDTIRVVNELISGTKYMVKNPDEFSKEVFVDTLGHVTTMLESFFTSMQMHIEVDQLIEKHDKDTT